jgi:hypothetical protein
MHYPQPTIGRRRPPPRLLVFALALSLSLVGWISLDVLRPPQAQAASWAEPAQGEYLGRWNYNQPDRETMTNIAVVSCPTSSPSCAGMPPFQIPQIGDMVLSAVAGGGIVGHTDQGCTWRFALHARSLELDPPSQYCFNQVIGSGYTITRWSVTVSGSHETEIIEAISHQPSGDLNFRLQNGSRTKVVNTSNRAVQKRFAGTWAYDTADPRSGVNILTSRYTDPDGQVRVVNSAQTGSVIIAKGRDYTIRARTGNGCEWTLVVRGNTAELQPAMQTCRTGGSTMTLRFWSIASDGGHQASIMAGTDDRDGSFLLIAGSLTKQ